MLSRGKDKAKANCDQTLYADRIWLTVWGADFHGTVALNSDTAKGLVDDLESCIDDIRSRKVN